MANVDPQSPTYIQNTVITDPEDSKAVQIPDGANDGTNPGPHVLTEPTPNEVAENPEFQADEDAEDNPSLLDAAEADTAAAEKRAQAAEKAQAEAEAEAEKRAQAAEKAQAEAEAEAEKAAAAEQAAIEAKEAAEAEAAQLQADLAEATKPDSK